MSEKCVETWTIYQQPKDFPDGFVVRLFHNALPTDIFYFTETLEEARAYIPRSKNLVGRHPQDPPSIVETWL
jgi:hypothetical protein